MDSYSRDYSAHTNEEREEMLSVLGLASIDDLFKVIPHDLKLHRKLNLPKPHDEIRLLQHIESLAYKNYTTKTHINFLGGGSYEHFIPAIIDTIVDRGELKTSYTPYQPSISQGLLQILYEYQMYIKAITGCEVVNASVYDGATALAEAAFMVIRKKAKKRLLIDSGIWSQYQSVLRTYFLGQSINIEILNSDSVNGDIDLAKLRRIFERLQPDGFLFQHPNNLGILEDVSSISQICQEHDVISVLSYNPILSGIATPPAAMGIDIVSGNGQALGIPLRAGGSSLGFLGSKLAFKPYLPGRIIGKNDHGYTLIAEEREQHVAREKATSNICSNQALNAIRAAIFLSYMGESGLSSMASLSFNKAHYLCDALCQIPHVSLFKNGMFFNEFCLLSKKPIIKWQQALLRKGIFAGIDISHRYQKNAILIAVTELKSKADLDYMIKESYEVLTS